MNFFQNFIFFTEGFCKYVTNDHVLLNISTVTGKWFRKFVFKSPSALHADNNSNVYSCINIHTNTMDSQC